MLGLQLQALGEDPPDPGNYKRMNHGRISRFFRDAKKYAAMAFVRQML